MRLHIARALLFFMVCLHGFAQGVGSTEQEVLKAYGPPQLQRDGSAGTIWIYANGTRLVLSKGVVIETNVSEKQAAPVKSEVRSDYTTRTLEPAPTPHQQTNRAGRPQPEINLSPLAIILVVLGALLSVAAVIWQIVLAFQTSVAWGVCSLLVPMAGVLFIFMHWSEGKKPLALYLSSMIPGGIGIALMIP